MIETNNEIIKTEDALRAWPDPISLDEVEMPIFPLKCLPGIGQKMVDHISELYQCDLALPGACLLGIYALSTQRYVTVSAGSQKEETALWIVPVAGVSERKSSVFAQMLQPAYNFEQAEGERLKQSIAENQSKRTSIKARISKLEKKAGETEDPIEREMIHEELTNSYIDLEATQDIFPPRLVVDNMTEEVIAKLMKQNGERIALVSAEPTLFEQLHGTGDRRPVLDVFLKAYNGESIRVDRISRESIMMDRPVMTIIAASQPEAVRDFVKTPRFNERGILSRFLFVPCEKRAGTRFWNGRETDTGIQRAYEEHITTMLSDNRERELTLSPEALNIYIAHYNQVEQMQCSGGVFDENGWAGKQPGRVLRLAGVIHCAEGYSGQISQDTLIKAVELSEYFIQAELYIRGTICESKEAENMKKILNWAISKTQFFFTIRDLQQSLRRHFTNADELRNHLRKLEELGHVRPYPGKTESYQLNPHYRKTVNMSTNWAT